jgi:hypothetical protein
MEFCSMGIQMPGAEYVQLYSTRTLLDFDVVLIDPQGIQNVGREHYARRKDDVVELLSRGGAVVLFVRPGPLDLLLPIEGASGDAYSGSKVDVVGPEPFQQFWTAAQSLMQYEAIVRGNAGTATFVVSNTNKVIGSWQRTGRGLVILLPAPKQAAPELRQQLKVDIMAALRALIEGLQASDAPFELPRWVAGYHWPEELELARKKSELETVAAETAKKITELAIQLEREQRLKMLLAAKGDLLLDAVADTFQKLGAQVERGEPGRDDLVLTWDGQFAVVEVKGKKGSAAEKDAAQLEKWVAGFKEVRDADAKGILVVNAFCEKSLAQRVDPAFPAQMLKYSTQREHCLITSTQLLGVLLSCRADNARKASYLEAIFITTGVFSEFVDYKMFLAENDTSATP